MIGFPLRSAVAFIALAASQTTTAWAQRDPVEEILGGTVEQNNTRVVGGIDAADGAYPFYAYLNGENGLCGSAVIAPTWLLTAAHCVQDSNLGGNGDGKIFDARDFEAAPGGAPIGEQPTLSVRRLIPYPKFGEEYGLQHDIALIELSEPTDQPSLTLTDAGDFQPDLPVRIIGYGHTEFNGFPSFSLKEAHTKLVSREDCTIVSEVLPELGPIDETRICADVQGESGIVDSCHGDSGGPLLTETPNGHWNAIGIVSYGFKCAVPGHPGVYTNVAAYRPWVEHVMAGGDPNNTNPQEMLSLPSNDTPPPSAGPTAIEDLFELVDIGGMTIEKVGPEKVGVGDNISFAITSNVTGSLTVFDIGSTGDAKQIFPNERTRKGRVPTSVDAGQVRLLPHRRDGFRLNVDQGSALRWVVAMVMPESDALSQVVSTRGLAPIEKPGDYLRAVLSNARNQCEDTPDRCAIGVFRLNLD